MAARRNDRKKGFGAAVPAIAGAVAALGAIAAGLFLARRRPGEGHAAPDLALDAPRAGTVERAPVAFRPDPTAPVSAEDREALRPATGPSPTLVEDRGAVRSQP